MTFPAAPDVPETRLSREPVASVNTLALTPTPDELMAAASPARVLSEEFSAIVCGAPLAPTCSVMEPAIVSEAFPIAVRYPLDVWARFVTSTVCVPAIAAELAAVSVNTFWSELEPSFSDMIP
jgi:hypothetical protein